MRDRAMQARNLDRGHQQSSSLGIDKGFHRSLMPLPGAGASRRPERLRTPNDRLHRRSPLAKSNHPTKRSETVMPEICRVLSFLLASALLATIADPAAAATVNRQAINQVSQLILNSFEFLSENKDTRSARAECEKALKLEERFDSDPFISATVNVCFGDVEDYEENKIAACQHYNQALKEFHATPAKHPAQRVLKNQIKAVEGKIFYLSCAAGSADKK
jgi:hypothetical protein